MKKLTYIADKKGDRLEPINGQLMKQEIKELPEGRYRIIIEKYYSKATKEQFSYLYGIVYPYFLQAANNNGYDFANVDEVDLWAKAQWAKKEVMNRETGQIVSIPLTKSEFKTIDEMVWSNTLRDYCAEYWGVYIPDPKK